MLFFLSAKIWLYEECSFSITLQYFCWVLYSLLLITFATGFTHLVSPQAIGMLYSHVLYIPFYLPEICNFRAFRSVVNGFKPKTLNKKNHFLLYVKSVVFKSKKCIEKFCIEPLIKIHF